jgi:probable F420-dependent oxidoreductase
MKVGFVVLTGEDQGFKHPPRYPEIRKMALAAEASGFDSIWLFDHLLFRFGGGRTTGIWECWTMLTALAEATQSVELGTLVLCSQFRNPALLAKMAITLDEISEGRVILGLGAGWHRPEFDAFGFPFDHRVGRFEEALQIIGPLLREGHVDFQGEYYTARDCEITPRGPRPQGPPLLVGAFGPRMLRLAAQHAQMWNHAWLGEHHGLIEPLASLKAACAQVGRDPASLDVTVAASVVYPHLGETHGYGAQPLAGSAEQIAATMQGYADLGVSHLVFQVTPYTIPALERLAQSLRLFRDR